MICYAIIYFKMLMRGGLSIKICTQLDVHPILTINTCFLDFDSTRHVRLPNPYTVILDVFLFFFH